jgi:hypothetical protein
MQPYFDPARKTTSKEEEKMKMTSTKNHKKDEDDLNKTSK